MRFTRSAVLLMSFALPLAVSSTALADSSCYAVANNIVANCGFETGNFSGWTLNDPSNWSSVDRSNPNTGTYFAYLGAEPGTLSQTLTDTAGAVYTLTFSLENEIAIDGTGTPYPGGNSFGVSITDVNSVTTSLMDPTQITETNNYNLYSFTFVGTGTDTLTFSMDNVPGYYDLDDVSANTPTPEPSSLALMGTGAVAFAAYSRRKIKIVQ